jgi:hypothetical protein
LVLVLPSRGSYRLSGGVRVQDGLSIAVAVPRVRLHDLGQCSTCGTGCAGGEGLRGARAVLLHGRGLEAGRFVLRRGKNGRAVFRRKTLRSRLHQYRLSYQLVGVPTNGLAGGHGEGAAALAG